MHQPQTNAQGEGEGERILGVVVVADAGVVMTVQTGFGIETYARGKTPFRSDACTEREEPGPIRCVAANAFEGLNSGSGIEGIRTCLLKGIAGIYGDTKIFHPLPIPTLPGVEMEVRHAGLDAPIPAPGKGDAGADLNGEGMVPWLFRLGILRRFGPL